MKRIAFSIIGLLLTSSLAIALAQPEGSRPDETPADKMQADGTGQLASKGTPVKFEPRNGSDEKPELPLDEMPANLHVTEAPIGFESLPVVPKDNPQTPEKIQLGRRLFFDPVLSADKTVSCASCHQPEHGFASGNVKAVGIDGRVGKRNAPSLLNRAYGEIFLWDGSASTLEEQALTPIGNPDEMGGSVEAVLKVLNEDESYKKEFAAVFGDNDPINKTNLAKAIASFERTLIAGNSLVDQFRSSDYRALSREARTGMWLFESRAGCWKCHSGPNLSDEQFHNTGVGFGDDDRDLGRMMITKKEEDRHAFKTPSLRGVASTAPFMHDGSVKTLKEVVEFYNRGGAPDDPELDDDMEPLKLTDEEVGFLVEFLKALSGEEESRFKKAAKK